MSRPFELKSHYQESVLEYGTRLHFAAHSHHPWPDVTKDAQIAAWDFAARHLDQKWDVWFQEELPVIENFLCELLGVSKPAPGIQSFGLAPNTHQLLCTLLSAHPEFGKRPLRILSTDSEFHSFSRQMNRFSDWKLGTTDLPGIEWIQVPTLPSESFTQRLETAFRETQKIDVFFTSHVFFNHGGILEELESVVRSFRSFHSDRAKQWMIVDGYHALGAVPVNIRKIENEIFYLGGGYKYLQAGEGACFCYVPPHLSALKPVITGWFSNLGALSQPGLSASRLAFGARGAALWGATVDLSAWFRMRAVFDFWQGHFGSLTAAVQSTREHVLHLQSLWVEQWKAFCKEKNFSLELPLHGESSAHGNFLSIPMKEAVGWTEKVSASGILTDCRAPYWRIGFGAYHTETDISEFFRRMKI